LGHLVKPHGGQLCNLVVDEKRAEQIRKESGSYPSISLTQRQLCDLELLMNGAFSPLTGFMTRRVYDSVLETLRLPDNLLWPMPITLDVADEVAEKLQVGMNLALLDSEGFMLAVLSIEEIWTPDKMQEAKAVYGTTSDQHPSVRYLLEEVHDTYIGGTVSAMQLPAQYDFETLRDTPRELRSLFDKLGWRKVVAFHTSKPMHRMHYDVTLLAAKQANAHILIHPVVGMAKPGDLKYYARVHCYEAIRRKYSHSMAALSLLPLAVRMSGPRDALLNGIIRQNYGCSHIVIGPDHASPPGADENGAPFYPLYAAQEIIKKYEKDLEISMIPFRKMEYVPKARQYMTIDEIDEQGSEIVQLQEDELKYKLAHNLDIPEWYSYPDVIKELRKICPPRTRQGITLFFTGLSGAGKSTVAKIVYAKFIESRGRPVTLLDGDVVRHNLSSELGFSKAHRDLNVRRIGFVASEITKNGGIAICAPIAPYSAMRKMVREMIEQHGAFIEIHVATPLDICEQRDRKGLYAKARKGIIPEFTGISDPYEIPETPEIRIDTSGLSPVESAQDVILYLMSEGYLDMESGE